MFICQVYDAASCKLLLVTIFFWSIFLLSANPLRYVRTSGCYVGIDDGRDMSVSWLDTKHGVLGLIVFACGCMYAKHAKP